MKSSYQLIFQNIIYVQKQAILAHQVIQYNEKRRSTDAVYQRLCFLHSPNYNTV